MTKKPGSEPAFPSKGQIINNGTDKGGIELYSNLTLRQHAAIQLRVPESGEPWLDGMIRRARRLDFVKVAMQGISSNSGYINSISEHARNHNIRDYQVIAAYAVEFAKECLHCLDLESETREE